MSVEPPILFAVDADGIGTLTLNRPEQLNAFDLEMVDAWRSALEQAEADERVKVIVVAALAALLPLALSGLALGSGRLGVSGGRLHLRLRCRLGRDHGRICLGSAARIIVAAVHQTRRKCRLCLARGQNVRLGVTHSVCVGSPPECQRDPQIVLCLAVPSTRITQVSELSRDGETRSRLRTHLPRNA